jgi:membrane protease YdiL (CAAX protease family)
MPKTSFRPMLAFMVLAYMVSWSIWIELARVDGILTVPLFDLRLSMSVNALCRSIGEIGPGLAAIVVILGQDGKAELSRIFRSLVPRRGDSGWIMFALGLPILTVLAVAFWTDPNLSSLPDPHIIRHWLFVFIFNLPFSPFCEEIGWRGYLLPNLEKRFKPLLASLIVGLVWGPWHAPLHTGVVFPGIPYGVVAFLFLVFVLGGSIMFSWLFHSSGDNLLTTIFLHASINTTGTVILGPIMLKFGIAPFIRLIVIIWSFDVAVLLTTDGRLSSRRPPHV